MNQTFAKKKTSKRIKIIKNGRSTTSDKLQLPTKIVAQTPFPQFQC